MENPYLSGIYAPTEHEIDVAALEVIAGEIPRDLFGSYVRNGPNPRFAPRGRHHWFDGDGMLHAIRFENGHARYRNRYVRTAGLARDEEEGRAVWTGLMESVKENPRGIPYKDTGNTDVVFHNGELLTSWYITGAAHRVDPDTLETRGLATLGRERPVRVSAHTKVDPITGELVFFQYGPMPPFMRYGVASPEGIVTTYQDIALPGPRLPHDMAMTANYSVLMDLPVFFSPEALMAQKWSVGYYPELPARFGVLPRQGGEVKWFEAEPCYIYHVINAWEEGESIVMTGCRVTDPIPTPDPAHGQYAQMMANLRVTAHLHRWRFDLKTGQTHEEPLDDQNTEFPCIDQRALGRKNRFSYNMRIPDAPTLLFDGVVKYDLDTTASTTLPFGGERFGSEVAFAPAEGSAAAGEDAGYLLSFVSDRAEGTSECWVIDARDIEAGPVAKLRIPQRVPLGFHATWVPGASVPGAAGAPSA